MGSVGSQSIGTLAPPPRRPSPKEVEVVVVKRGGKRIDPSKARKAKS
jgi:hypothetical protein